MVIKRRQGLGWTYAKSKGKKDDDSSIGDMYDAPDSQESLLEEMFEIDEEILCKKKALAKAN